MRKTVRVSMYVRVQLQKEKELWYVYTRRIPPNAYNDKGDLWVSAFFYQIIFATIFHPKASPNVYQPQNINPVESKID